MNYTSEREARLFLNYDGMFVYLKLTNRWGTESYELVETNDPAEAVLNQNHLLARKVRSSDGNWVTAKIKTVIEIVEDPQ